MTARRLGPDIVRGILITLVIFGHTISSSVNDDLLKWSIYSFHIPLFFGLTGSLINVEKLRSRNAWQLLTYYFTRMGWQWIVASAIFALVNHREIHSKRDFVRFFITDPYFHLWFIPALFVMVLMTWVLLKLKASVSVVWVIAFALWVLFDGIRIQDSVFALDAREIDYRFVGMLLWFVTGMALARHPLRWSSFVIAPVSAVAFAIYLYAFPSSGLVRDISYLILNFSLIALLPHIDSWFEGIRVASFFAPVGQYSLWIYLLHPLATDVLRKSSEPHGLMVGIWLTVALLALSRLAIAAKETLVSRSNRA